MATATSDPESNTMATSYQPWSDIQGPSPFAPTAEKPIPKYAVPRYQWGQARRQKLLAEQNRELNDDEDVSLDEMSSRGEEVYIVHQKFGYYAIGFSVAQILVLAIMMIQCGVAPFALNPMFGPYPDTLSEWGGKNAVDILDEGEWWRLITPIFLHAGVVHLFCNIAVQLDIGAFFEREWGSHTWLAIYLSSAVGSSILSVIAMPDTISVGSSGAVMGIFGGKLAEVLWYVPSLEFSYHVMHQISG